MHLEEKKSQLQGGFKELIALFFPLLLTAFTNYLFFLVEKLFLASLSVEAMEAAVNAAYASQLFQVPCIAIAAMAQIYVGRCYGAHKWQEIGPTVWQFIWFSCLSIILTFPFSLVYGKIYFEGTDIEEIVLPYFYFNSSFNFLYPLGTTLMCFYLGLRKTRLILIATVGFQSLKLILTYLLIFGWKNWIPSLGLMGGAVSTLIAQGGFCLLLFGVFLNSHHSHFYGSRNKSFRPRLFWECIHPAFLRALSRILMIANWVSIARLMTLKGEGYLLLLSIGGALFLFLPFLGEAICQAQVTVISNILGAHRYFLMDRAFYSGTKLVLMSIALFGVPLVMFPVSTFHYLFPELVLQEEIIANAFWGIWLCFAFSTFCFIPLAYILAFKDTKFLLFMGIFNWINGFLLMYIAIEVIQIQSQYFWLTLGLMHGSMAFLYYFRMKKLIAISLSDENVDHRFIPILNFKG